MDFDDRLRNHMHEQGGNLTIRPEGSDAVARRARMRRQRRTAGAIAAALVVVVGMFGWIISTRDTDSVQVTTEGPVDVTADDDAGEESASEVAQPVDDVDDLPDATPAPGDPLVFEPIDNDGAPGGFNVYENGATGGLYYVLSTAPGVTYETLPEDEWFIRNDTLYTYDGDRWASGGFGDRFVSTIDSSASGALYTISTGSPQGAALEIGTSVDGGDSWAWTPIDLTAQFGEDATAWPAYNVRSTGDDVRVVIVSKVTGPDYEQGIALAQEAGLEIDPEFSIVLDVTAEGIRYIPGASTEPSPCQREFSSYVDEQLQSLEEAAAEEGELDDEFYRDFQERYDAIQREALELVGSLEGCEVFVECQSSLLSQSEAITAEERRIVTAMGYDPDSNYWEELSDEQLTELSTALEELGVAESAWLASSGCGETLFGPAYAIEDDEGEFVTWESLGVTPPASWQGSTHTYLVDGDEVTPLGSIFGDVGFLVSLETRQGRFEATFDNAAAFDTGQGLVTWSSSDGISWTSAPAAGDVYGYFGEGEFDRWRFSLAWDEVDTRIRRVDDVGSVDSFRLADLAPGIAETGDFTLVGLSTGGYGVAAWAVDWEGGGRSIVVYSPDGVAWGATALDIEVVDLIVGPDGVLAFMQDREIVGTGNPQPIFRGTA